MQPTEQPEVASTRTITEQEHLRLEVRRQQCEEPVV